MSLYCRHAAIAMASKLSDMQLGDSMDIGPLLTKKEVNQAGYDLFFFFHLVLMMYQLGNSLVR